MFMVGDCVVHPMHGAGVIHSIVTETVGGLPMAYYVFQLPFNTLLLKIPVQSSETLGLRAVMTPAQAAALLQALPGLPVRQEENWSRRYRENMERMKSGNVREVCLVIKTLLLRERERGLSAGDRKMLQTAKQILLSEWMLSTGQDYAEAERNIINAALAV